MFEYSYILIFILFATFLSILLPAGSYILGIKKPDGSINTGFYPNWRSLSKEQKDQVAAERKKRKNRKNTARGQNAIKTELESLKKKLGKNKRTIAALRYKVTASKDGDGRENDDGEISDDAGDSFGGKRNKKSKTKESS